MEHNGWNRIIETNLVNIGEEAVCMRWMHNESIRFYYGKYGRLNNWLRIFTSVITGLTGIAFLSNYYYYVLVLRLLTGLLSIIVIYISTTLKGEDYPTLITKHRLSSYNYYSIFQSINRELSFSRLMRREAKGFYESVNEDFNKLKINSPDISEEVLLRFEQKFGVIEQLYRIDVYHQRDPERGNPPGSPPPTATPAANMLRNWRESMLGETRDGAEGHRARYEIERFTQQN